MKRALKDGTPFSMPPFVDQSDCSHFVIFYREQTIQVNALSTALVGLLLFSWMKQAVAAPDRQCHLIFVTSRDHTDPDITAWPLDPDKNILEHLSSAQNWPTNQFGPNYANSKLILTYVVEELCRRAVDTNTDE